MKSLQFKFARIITTMALVLVPVLVPVAVHADSTVDTGGNACSGANLDLTGGQSGSCTDTASTSVSNLLKTVINIFSLVVGAVSVIMIIIGGFRYITSGGESSSVSGAKNTIIYALIGLIIVVLAQIIVQFVLNKTNGALSSS